VSGVNWAAGSLLDFVFGPRSRRIYPLGLELVCCVLRVLVYFRSFYVPAAVAFSFSRSICASSSSILCRASSRAEVSIILPHDGHPDVCVSFATCLVGTGDAGGDTSMAAAMTPLMSLKGSPRRCGGSNKVRLVSWVVTSPPGAG